ncbi:hydrogenase nickel incorporation protein HypB [Patescibacteria group bacterium]
MKKRIPIKKQILSENDKLAQKLQKKFDTSNTIVVNIMASPGAGKTSIIYQLIKQLKTTYSLAVIDGDVVDIDIKKLQSLDIPVALANTGGACHLDAYMIKKSLQSIKLHDIDLLIIENVGNLICPANFKLGSHKNIVIASIPEGSDKPYKYPQMFLGADLVLLNKTDLLSVTDFDMQQFEKGIKRVNNSVSYIPLSAKTGVGISNVVTWLSTLVSKKLS